MSINFISHAAEMHAGPTWLQRGGKYFESNDVRSKWYDQTSPVRLRFLSFLKVTWQEFGCGRFMMGRAEVQPVLPIASLWIKSSLFAR